MRGIFNHDGPFFGIMEKVADLILLNLVWLLCCLPVITIGTSTVALYHVVWKLNAGESGPIVRTFFTVFRREWKQGTVLTFLAAVLLLLMDVNISAMLSKGFGLVYILHVAVSLLIIFTVSYLFPLQALFQNTVVNTVKNALIISLANLPISILVALINLSPLLGVFLSLKAFWFSLLFWLSLGAALIASVNMLLLKKVFIKFMPEQNEN